MKRLLKLMIIVIAVMAVLVAGGVFFYLHYKSSHSRPKPLTLAQQQALQVALPEMTTNLKSGSIVQFTVTLQASDAATQNEIKDMTPAIEDELNRIMRQYTDNDLDSSQGLAQLENNIRTTVNSSLPKGSVTKVLFVSILTQ